MYKPLFCNSCHRPIEIPESVKNSNIKTTGGIRIACGYPNCKGKVKFKSEPKEGVVSGS